MRDWIRRNAGPIAAVLVAAAIVIVLFEIVDALAGSTAESGGEEAGNNEQAPAAAGLIKVALFLVVGAAPTLYGLRRTKRSNATT
ncbi:MAG: hypothetical protein KJO87_07005 [Acidimicrobiia bacterium]|nr:hypothetical protein [Acidimicrobiia bacterium]